MDKIDVNFWFISLRNIQENLFFDDCAYRS